MNDEYVSRHISTHSKVSKIDSRAISELVNLLSYGESIMTNTQSHDTWPNHDGFIEIIKDVGVSSATSFNFVVQVKGTTNCKVATDGGMKYLLPTLNFPAYIYSGCDLNPGILFVIGMAEDGVRHCYWKHMSYKFLSEIDYKKDSVTIDFTDEDRLQQGLKSIEEFKDKLIKIYEDYSFLNTLSKCKYSKEEFIRIIQVASDDIDSDIACGTNRDNVSRKILSRIHDLCTGVLMAYAYAKTLCTQNLATSYELAVLDRETNFLCKFLKGIKYLNGRVPLDGQSERLMLKYYTFLWDCRELVNREFGLTILQELELFPLNIDTEDIEYYESVANAVDDCVNPGLLEKTRYKIVDKKPFFYNKKKYYEVTVQLSGKHSSKFNRFIAYSTHDISMSHSVQLELCKQKVNIFNFESEIHVINKYKVSIEPSILNSLAKLLNINIKISSGYKEYEKLMIFFYDTGMSFIRMIDLSEERFSSCIEQIYCDTKTSHFKEILRILHSNFNIRNIGSLSVDGGINTIRYLLAGLSDELIGKIIDKDGVGTISRVAKLNKGCVPFENKPFLYDLPKTKIHAIKNLNRLISATGLNKYQPYDTYIKLKQYIEKSGEMYLSLLRDDNFLSSESINTYNRLLSKWDLGKGKNITVDEMQNVSIAEYEDNATKIFQDLLNRCKGGRSGQAAINKKYVKLHTEKLDEDLNKKNAVLNAFTQSKIQLIYGAAGTGKTTLIGHFSELMKGKSKLCLAMTNPAVKKLETSLEFNNANDRCMTIDKFIRSDSQIEYDAVYIDECSVVDNYSMMQVLSKINTDSVIIMAGDIYQIDSIEFGNWFQYACDIIPKSSIIELTSAWRTDDEKLKSLWTDVRLNEGLAHEKLVIDGPFSENISENIFSEDREDSIILCLNYDGRYGLNNINNFFQDKNPNPSHYWKGWSYKVGDPILFNSTERFPFLYNNLKGKIRKIKINDLGIYFIIEVPIEVSSFNAHSCFIDVYKDDNIQEGHTVIGFYVHNEIVGATDEEREISAREIVVPFHISYAVSIHKSQGLEYESVEIIIPKSSAANITHGIFYTAITRAKKDLRIFWSSETMNAILCGFSAENKGTYSLNILKHKLFEK